MWPGFAQEDRQRRVADVVRDRRLAPGERAVDPATAAARMSAAM